MSFKIPRNFMLLAALMNMVACNGGNGVPGASGDSPPPAALTGIQEGERAMKIVQWGPSEVTAGTTFNPQSSGLAAVWMQMGQPMSQSSASIWWDDRKLDSAVAGSGISAEVPAELYATPGKHALQVRASGQGHEERSNVVYLTVK